VIVSVIKFHDYNLPVVVIDLGGTKIAAGVISEGCQVLAKECFPTPANEGVEAVIKRIISASEAVTKSADMALRRACGISIAAAGAIDSERGVITLSPNLPGWRDIPLRDILTERLGIKAWLINDTNAAALGEHHLGIGQGVDNLIYITLGTGIGGAIILDGKLYTGVSGSAGEIGHMTIDASGLRCKCGNTGCWETLASGTAVVREAITRINHGQKSSLTEIVAGRLEQITAETVAMAARDGDSLARDVIKQAATYLGVGLVNLVNIFNPAMIVIGGGLAKMGDQLLDPAREIVKERAFPIAAQTACIVPTQLGDDAGILGAAIFARQQEQD